MSTRFSKETGNSFSFLVEWVQEVEGPMRYQIWLCALAVLCPLGCQHIGPSTIVEDRVAYDDAVATSWKEQTLLNIVKLRYFDTPFFTDVAQIVSGYSLGAQATPTPGFTNRYFPGASFGDRLMGSLPLQAAYIDRPTVSYAPQTRPDFIRNLTVPLPPTAVLYLMQAGYPVDLVFDLTLDAINGIPGRSCLRGTSPAGEPGISTHRPDPAQGPTLRQCRDADRSWQGQDTIARHVLP